MSKLFFLSLRTTGSNLETDKIEHLEYNILVDNKIVTTEVVNIELPELNEDDSLSKIETTPGNIVIKDLTTILNDLVNSFDSSDNFIIISEKKTDVAFLKAFFKQNNVTSYNCFFSANSIDIVSIITFGWINGLYKNINLDSTLRDFANTIGNVCDEDTNVELVELIWHNTNNQLFSDNKPIKPKTTESNKWSDSLKQLIGLNTDDPKPEPEPLPEHGNIDSLDHIINFGQHEGKTFQEIFNNTPQYLLWLHNNDIRGIRFTEELLNIIQQRTIDKKQEDYAKPKEFTEFASFDSIIPFGKYSNSTVATILNSDPHYLAWIQEKSPKGYCFNAEMWEQIERACSKTTKTYGNATKGSRPSNENLKNHSHQPSRGDDDVDDDYKDDLPF